MCYFVTLGVPSASEGSVRFFSDAGFEVERSSNESLLTAFGTAAFHVTIGGCSCDLHSSDRDLRAKYERKGWSATKIRRALRDRQSSGTHGAGKRFRGALREFVSVAGEALVFGHWYSGAVEDEAVQPLRSVRIDIEQYLASDNVFREDELLVVGRNA